MSRTRSPFRLPEEWAERYIGRLSRKNVFRRGRVKLNDAVVLSLWRFERALRTKTGGSYRLKVTSGVRTAREQRRLRRILGPLVAAIRSRHQAGLAVDVKVWTLGLDVRRIARMLGQAGFEKVLWYPRSGHFHCAVSKGNFYARARG